MKISTRGRYALRCMLNMALKQDEKAKPISRISEQEGISSNYIEQLFLQLKKGGLIESKRGRGGGYKLARKPARIPVSEIIEIVEGPIIAVDCVENGKCERYEICATKYLWEILSSKLNEVLDGITLRDMCEIARDELNGDIENKLT